jgi:hypothetical protein
MSATIVLGTLVILLLAVLDAYEFVRRARRWSITRRAHDGFAALIFLGALSAFFAVAHPLSVGVPLVMLGLYFVYFACVSAYEWMAEIWSFELHEAPKDRIDEMNLVVRQRLLPTEEAQIEDSDTGHLYLRIRRVDRAKARQIVDDLQVFLEENRTVPRFRVVWTTLTQGVYAGLIAFVVLEMLR